MYRCKSFIKLINGHCNFFPCIAAAQQKTTGFCPCGQSDDDFMIACDHEKCKYQWFHYVCVALDVIPDGDWYCPECAGRQILAHAFSVSLGRRAGTVNRGRGGWENTTQF